MHKIKSASIIIQLVLMISLGCSEISVEIQDNEIAKARKWFEANSDNLIHPSTSSPIGKEVDKYPDWISSQKFTTKSGYNAVEVRLIYDRELILTNQEIQNRVSRPVLSSLMLVEISPEQYVTYILKYFPENVKDFDFERLNLSNVTRVQWRYNGF